jgi:hypothetical protein
MKITFKKIEDGLKNEIFVDEMYIGYVEINIWNQKWKIYPQFNFSPMEQGALYVQYLSFYKAGKAMTKLYCDTFMLYDETEEGEGDGDTQPINMSGIWGNHSGRP